MYKDFHFAIKIIYNKNIPSIFLHPLFHQNHNAMYKLLVNFYKNDFCLTDVGNSNKLGNVSCLNHGPLDYDKTYAADVIKGHTPLNCLPKDDHFLTNQFPHIAHKN